jgi:hypothetical protein
LCENDFMNRYLLPHGAKGIEAEGFALAFGADKVVFIGKPRIDGEPNEPGTEMHYTFHAGLDSGIVDLHETRTAADGQKHYRTLFALRTNDIPPVLQQLTPMLAELMSLVRPLRLGWLAHRGIGIARGIDPLDDQAFAAVTRKRKSRLVVVPQLYEQNVFVPEYLDEVYDFPDGNFALLRRGRHLGIGFKATDPAGNIQLSWMKRRDITRFGNRWQPKIIDALRSAAIPREQYPDYPYLRS